MSQKNIDASQTLGVKAKRSTAQVTFRVEALIAWLHNAIGQAATVNSVLKTNRLGKNGLCRTPSISVAFQNSMLGQRIPHRVCRGYSPEPLTRYDNWAESAFQTGAACVSPPRRVRPNEGFFGIKPVRAKRELADQRVAALSQSHEMALPAQCVDAVRSVNCKTKEDEIEHIDYRWNRIYWTSVSPAIGGSGSGHSRPGSSRAAVVACGYFIHQLA
jgi:hypothetical protein